MRWTTVLFLIVVLPAGAAAQSRITLREKNAPLEKILSAMEKQTLYVFLFDPNELKVSPITISITNATLQQILETIFKDRPVEFTIVGNNVLLKRTAGQNQAIPPSAVLLGRVIENTGTPLQGVTVFNERQNKTTQTDSAGLFAIPGTKGDRLLFTFVGFHPRTALIGDRPALDIQMEPYVHDDAEVVVVGYGSTKRRDLTGAISVINMKNKDEIPFNTVDNLLAGQAAGVQVIKDDGTPGGMVRVRIRGLSSLLGGVDPLYVIDGIPVQVRNNFIDPGFRVPSATGNLTGTNYGNSSGVALPASFVNSLNSLAGLDPADIESISVLKDASSAAIYGSKAANGVVIITTKTASRNSQSQITVDYSSTVATPYKLPKLLNATQYKTLLTEAANNCITTGNLGQTGTYPYVKAIADTPGYFASANTNWVKQVTLTTIEHEAGVSASGGSPSTRYFTSFHYNHSPGVLDNTGFERGAAKLTLETVVGSKLRLASNFLLAATNQSIGSGSYMQAQLARPDRTPRDTMGNFTNFEFYGSNVYGLLNPVALTTATNTARTLSLLGSVSASYDLSADLRLKSAVSVNAQNYNQRNYLPRYINLQTDYDAIPNPGGIGCEANSRFADWFLENTVSWNPRFWNGHALDIVVGQSYETTKYSFFSATAAGYPNDAFLNGLSSADSVVSIAGDEPRSPQSYLLSFYARANYSYKDKYLLTFTGRSDGSSKFGPDHKYGYFPSGAIDWRVSRENFLADLTWIDEAKLRASYGLTGNQNIGDQMYRTLFINGSYNGTGALIPLQLGNSAIKWETTRESDIGLELSLLKDRIEATADYYDRRTDGALLTSPIAPSTSYAQLLQNSVGLRNHGWELTITGSIIRTKNLSWTTSVNATWSRSVVTKIDSNADLTQLKSPSGLESALYGGFGTSTTTITTGKPLGIIAGQIITGIIRTQAQLDEYNRQLGTSAQNPVRQIGDPMYKLDPSTASQGYEAPLYRQSIANGAPKVFGGMIQEFRYRNIGLHCFFAFSYGGHLLWAEHVATTKFFFTANAGKSMLDRWTPANSGGSLPRLDLTGEYLPTNLDVFSSSYLKLRSLTLDYRWKNYQFFLSATNVFTITKYPGSDPETSDDPYFVSGGYIDAGNYPAVRTFSLGLKATFK